MVLGRKNWLFSDTQDGAIASMTVFSMVETAKANGLDPQKYLLFLLDQRPGIEMTDDELDQLADAVVGSCESSLWKVTYSNQM